MEQILKTKKLYINRGKHWTTDAGYHETWEQILNYRSKRALCLEMEGAGPGQTHVKTLSDKITESVKF